LKEPKGAIMTEWNSEQSDTPTTHPAPETVTLLAHEDAAIPTESIVSDFSDGQDDIVAALSAMTPADLNIELMLDHLTASHDLFNSPHLDFSALAHSLGGHDHG
jgi:hypothetical protein